MHPRSYSDTKRVGELVPAGSEELGQLVALLRAAGVGAIIMKSALKGDGTHSLRQKEIDGKIYDNSIRLANHRPMKNVRGFIVENSETTK